MYFQPFPEANRRLGRPANMDPAEECGTLPVYTDGRQCVSCWLPSEQEREAIAAGLPVYLGVLSGETQPPVYVTTQKPSMPALQHALTPDWEDALKQFADRLPNPEYGGTRPQTGKELRIFLPDLLTPEGNPLQLDKLYYVGSPEAQAQHLRNLRALFMQGGKAAIVPYLQPYEAFLAQPDTTCAQ